MWSLTTSNKDLVNKIMLDEGSKEYQAKIGTYKNGKFVQYNDTLGKPTIGYGHLVLINESFKQGLTPDEASALLVRDLETAVSGAEELYSKYELSCPLEIQILLACLVYQIGKGGLSKFKNFLTALKSNNYKTAAAELKNSRLYKQAPNRIKRYIILLSGMSK